MLLSPLFGAPLLTQAVKNLPAVEETHVPSLDQEGPLEKATAAHPSPPAWRVPGTEGPGRLPSTGARESDTTEQLNRHRQPPVSSPPVLGFITVLPWAALPAPGDLPRVGPPSDASPELQTHIPFCLGST